jgi:hypothetical protein
MLYKLILILGVGLAISACGATPGATPAATATTRPPAATTAARATPVPEASATTAPVATTAAPATAPATTAPQPTTPADWTTFRDQIGGWAVEYPAEWTIFDLDDEAKQQGMGYTVTFQSFAPTGGSEQGIPEGEAKMDIGVYKEGITGSITALQQALAWRQQQFVEDGTNIVSLEPITLRGGLPAMRLVLEATRGPAAGEGQSLEIITVINGNVVLFDGYPASQVIDAIALTLRPLDAHS